MDEEEIMNEIEENRDTYVDFLKELIQIDSYNPPGNEMNVALRIEDYLKKLNIKCELIPFGENRANLIAYLNENLDGKNLFYNGHMDVVPPGSEGEWKFPPLVPTLKGSKKRRLLYGRGTTDMKGGLGAMIIALAILKKLDLKTSNNLILNAVADEETGGNLGTGWCLENKLKDIKCDFSIIGEPSGLNPLPKAIILGEKGHLQVFLRTNGISCHASMPKMGKNAVYMMSEIIQNLNKLENYIPKIKPPLSVEELKDLISAAFPSREDFERILNDQKLLQFLIESLTEFTYSFTVIHGEIKANVVPDKCEGIIDFRLLPGQTSEMVLNALRKLISEDLKYELRDEPEGKPNDIFVYLGIYHQGEASIWDNWRESPTLKSLYSITEKIYGKKPFYFIFPAAADAHYYRNNGYCPETVLFGPGNANTAHAVNESIEIQDFIDSIKVYTIFAYRFLIEEQL